MDAGSDVLPILPYAHTDTTAKPFINAAQVLFCVCIFEVTDPTADCIVQCFFALLISHSVAPLGEQFQFGFELSKRFRMDAKPSNTAASGIERVSKELDVPHTACNCLFTIDFEMEFLLYEVSDALFDAFRCSWSLAEDYAIVSIAHKRMSAFLQLLVKFVKNNVTEEWTEWAALRCTYIAFLHYTIDHHTRFKILMYQRYYSTILDCKG